jgi:hypothetical protein
MKTKTPANPGVTFQEAPPLVPAPSRRCLTKRQQVGCSTSQFYPQHSLWRAKRSAWSTQRSPRERSSLPTILAIVCSPSPAKVRVSRRSREAVAQPEPARVAHISRRSPRTMITTFTPPALNQGEQRRRRASRGNHPKATRAAYRHLGPRRQVTRWRRQSRCAIERRSARP